jgi:hypothetical protein
MEIRVAIGTIAPVCVSICGMIASLQNLEMVDRVGSSALVIEKIEHLSQQK